MTKMTAAIVFILASIVANAIPVSAQEPPAPVVGTWGAVKALPSRDEVTVNLKDGSRTKGKFTDATDTALMLSQGKKITEVRRDTILRVYRSIPKSRAIGTSTGAALGGGLALLSGISHDADPRATIALVAVWTGLGALIGRGLARSRERVLLYEAGK